jgi:hypothetical protein
VSGSGAVQSGTKPGPVEESGRERRWTGGGRVFGDWMEFARDLPGTSSCFPLHLAPEARHSDARLIGPDLRVPAQGLGAKPAVGPMPPPLRIKF